MLTIARNASAKRTTGADASPSRGTARRRIASRPFSRPAAGASTPCPESFTPTATGLQHACLSEFAVTEHRIARGTSMSRIQFIDSAAVGRNNVSRTRPKCPPIMSLECLAATAVPDRREWTRGLARGYGSAPLVIAGILGCVCCLSVWAPLFSCFAPRS
jgi:hypothetical protein